MQFRHIHVSLVSALALTSGLSAPSTAQAWAGATASPPPNRETGSDDLSNVGAKPMENDPAPVANDDEGPIMTTGLKAWITKGGSYCIREIAVDGKVRCQSEAAWAKEGVTFGRAMAAIP